MSRKGKYHFKCIVNPSLPQLIILFRQEWMSKASHDGIRVYSQTRVLKGDDFKFRVSLSKMVRPNPPPTPIPQKKWNECWVLLSYIWHIKYSINIKFIPSWFYFPPFKTGCLIQLLTHWLTEENIPFPFLDLPSAGITGCATSDRTTSVRSCYYSPLGP